MVVSNVRDRHIWDQPYRHANSGHCSQLDLHPPPEVQQSSPVPSPINPAPSSSPHVAFYIRMEFIINRRSISIRLTLAVQHHILSQISQGKNLWLQCSNQFGNCYKVILINKKNLKKSTFQAVIKINPLIKTTVNSTYRLLYSKHYNKILKVES